MVAVLVNGKPQIKNVQTGLSDEVNVEITSGLNAGDEVITSSLTTTKSSNSSSSSSSSSSSRSGSSSGGAGGSPAGL
jgi:hypothetical protein